MVQSASPSGASKAEASKAKDVATSDGPEMADEESWRKDEKGGLAGGDVWNFGALACYPAELGSQITLAFVFKVDSRLRLVFASELQLAADAFPFVFPISHPRLLDVCRSRRG